MALSARSLSSAIIFSGQDICDGQCFFLSGVLDCHPASYLSSEIERYGRMLTEAALPSASIYANKYMRASLHELWLPVLSMSKGLRQALHAAFSCDWQFLEALNSWGQDWHNAWCQHKNCPAAYRTDLCHPHSICFVLGPLKEGRHLGHAKGLPSVLM